MPYNLTFLNLLLAIICILINSKSTTGNKIQNAVVLFGLSNFINLPFKILYKTPATLDVSYTVINL